jgi:hypothetical protein
MEVASLELSKELYELSGWGNVGTYSSKNPFNYWVDRTHDDREHELNYGGGNIPSDGGIYPAYDLSYLLHKLPQKIVRKINHILMLSPTSGGDWRIWYDGETFIFYADTPEDAACKLAIELIKQGVIQPGETK